MANGTHKLSDRRKTLFVCAFFALTTALLYWRTVGYEFIDVDDHKYVYQNGMVQSGLSWAGIQWAFTALHASNWHPLTWLSHMLDCSVYGIGFPGGHHLTSAAIHIANMILLFLVLKELTGSFWPSAFTAALFGWHPAHVESAVWICERKDVLSMFFMTLTLWAYGRYVKKPTATKYLLALLLFAFGLMSKPMLVTLPFVLLLLDYWPLARFRKNSEGTPIEFTQHATRNTFRLLLEKIPFFLLSIVSCAITVIAQHRGGAMQTLDHITFSTRALNALAGYGAYLEKAIWPVNLSVFYPLPQTTPWALLTFSVIAIVLISYVAFRTRFSAPWLIIGWLWFLGTLVPVIGLVQVGNQAMADRYTYIPYIGLFIMLAWSGDCLLKRKLIATPERVIESSNSGPSAGFQSAPLSRPTGEGERPSNLCHSKPLIIAAASFVLLACFILSSIQLSYWHDSIQLFSHALSVTRSNVFCESNLSYALSEARRGKEAIPHYQALLQLTPGDLKARYNLGLELLSADQPAEAAAQFTVALKSQPESDKLHNSLGIALSQQGKLDDASVEFEKAIQLNPQFPWPYLNDAVVLQKKGCAGPAITNYTKALKFQPDWAEALDKLAYLHATCPDAPWHDPAKALQFATQANDLTQRKSPDLLSTLAIAHAAAGQFTNAVTTAELAEKQAQLLKLQPLAIKLQADLENYRAGKIAPQDWKTPPSSVIIRK